MLDPRIRSSLIESQTSKQDERLIISQAREFLREGHPHEVSISYEIDRPTGVSEDDMEDAANSTAILGNAFIGHWQVTYPNSWSTTNLATMRADMDLELIEQK